MANLFSVSITSGTQYVTFGSNYILGTLTNASVTMYIKNSSLSGGSGGALYCERAASGNDIWKLQTIGSTNTGLEFTHRDDAGTLDQPSETCTINDNAWHHI